MPSHLTKHCCLFMMLFFSGIVHSQDFISASQAEVLRQQALEKYPLEKWDSLRCVWYGECLPKVSKPAVLQQNACLLKKRFFGWHAIGSSSSTYQWNLLSDLSYFSYQVNPANGEPTNAAQMAVWGSDATVLAAKASGVKVSLCVTLFNNSTEFSTFFSSGTAPAYLVSRLVNEVVNTGTNGINIDFEGSGLTTTYLTQFVGFMSSLHTQLKAAKPDAEISIDLQGSFGSAGTMHAQLLPYVDLFILMGYDYYWGSQKFPGPIGPTYQFPKAADDPYGHGNVANDLNSLLRYVPSGKVILAMPYYGRRWKTTTGCTIPASGDAASLSVQTYTQFRQNSNGYYNNTYRDFYSWNAYHCFADVNSIPNQQFIDDTISLQRKYDLVWQRNLAGAAVWRLGYDAGYADCWNLVNKNLTVCTAAPDNYVLWDMGGPSNGYINNCQYSFTVSPSNASYLLLQITQLDLENGFDSLWLYNGENADAPLIAALSGSSLPNNMLASSGKMMVRFKSDGATAGQGFSLQYTAYTGPLVFRTTRSGLWHDASIWSTGIIPTALDSVIIGSGHVVTLQQNATARVVVIETGGELKATTPGVELLIKKL